MRSKASQAEGPELKIWEEEDGRGGKRQPADQAGAGPAASKASSHDDGLNKQVARIEKPQVTINESNRDATVADPATQRTAQPLQLPACL